MQTSPVRIAMWSGPRNISTAMLRSWGSRPDTVVTDEPFYAFYLRATGADHPGRDEVIAAHESDPSKVIAWITGPVPGGRPIWFQKHMSHHLLPGLDRAWVASMRSAFLIRDPAAMLASLTKVTPDVGLPDTGLPQQLELFESEHRRLGRIPPVIDAADVLRDPRAMLSALCAALEVPFDKGMLSWAPGPRDTDGIWARYWYSSVERSTGFEPYYEKPVDLPSRLHALERSCRAVYDRLWEHRLTPEA